MTVASPATVGSERIDRLLAVAQQQLGMEVAFVGRFDEDRRVLRAVHGDAASFGLEVGGGQPLEGTYCHRMVQGLLPQAVPDATADLRVRDLPGTLAGRVGAYVGVPLHLSDGELYGTFCCLSHDSRPALDEHDVALLRMLSTLLADELEDDAVRRRDRSEVLQVLDDRAVSVALQPIVELATGACVGVEALARFAPHPPEVLFAQAENAGLRSELEILCLEQALRRLPGLQPDQRLSVNLSPDVACALAEEGSLRVPLHRVVLEITEHTAVTSYDRLRTVLDPLRRRGLQLAVDDAGAGFASLRHILELQPDVIKIDRSLVAGLDTDGARRTVVTTFVLLALEIGASVTAEGVECPHELSTLADLGVDSVQGFLLARPSTAAADLSLWSGRRESLPWTGLLGAGGPA
jgi:EAL domain-containing protein (putative c-di-GMP-specific phosphodiesterase class I)